jgi:hypothetical protein
MVLEQKPSNISMCHFGKARNFLVADVLRFIKIFLKKKPK